MTITAPDQKARKERFFAANRGIPLLPAAISIAASWVWAPALFTSAEQAFVNGWVGLAWFTVPNVLVLIIFGWFATRMRDRLPDGYTLSGYMRERFSVRVQRVYIGQLTGLAIASFAVQIVAGGAVISFITGWDYWIVACLLGGAALSYSATGGLRASVAADFFHIGMTLLVVVSFAPSVIHSVGMGTVIDGMDSSHVDHLALALTFGIPTTIGLLSGPFGDQSFWQRSFAIRLGAVRKAFTYGGLIFAIVPLSMAVLGFAASGAGLSPDSTNLVNVQAVYDLLPSWTVVPFTIMVIGALVSTMDNNLVSASTLMGHDLTRQGDPIFRGRVAMIAVAILGTAIANIPGITVTMLFLIYGTFRASTVIPTVATFTMRKRQPSEHGMFWSVLLALGFGMPLFLYGSFVDGADNIKTLGSIVTIGTAAAITFACATRNPHWKDNA